jgi:hypothetical protein
LSLKLYKKDFPELVRAQKLLVSALRSEKTSAYVRLYVKEDASQPKWEQVKQA